MERTAASGQGRHQSAEQRFAGTTGPAFRQKSLLPSAPPCAPRDSARTVLPADVRDAVRYDAAHIHEQILYNHSDHVYKFYANWKVYRVKKYPDEN